MTQPLLVRIPLIEKSLPARMYFLTLQDSPDPQYASGSIRPDGETGVALDFSVNRHGLIRMLFALLGKVEEDDGSNISFRLVLE